MPRLRAAAAAALMLGALVVPRAQAAPPGWTVTGSRTSYVYVRLDFPTTLYTPTVSAKGRYGGVFAEQVSYKDGSRPIPAGGGWVAIRGLAADPRRLDPLHVGFTPQFEPGVIRLYLIADGPTTVRLDVSGPEGHRTFAPAKPTQASARVVPLSPAGPALAASVPLRLGRRDLAAAVVQVTGERSFLADATVCVRAANAACEKRPEARFLSSAAGDGVGPLDPERRWQWAGFASGNAVADASVDPLETVTRAVLAGFSLRLVDDRP